MRRWKRWTAFTMAALLCMTMASCGKKPTGSEDMSEEQTEESTEGPTGENLIENGDFSDGLTNWMIYTEGGTANQVVTEDGEMEIQVTDVGTLDYAIQPYYDGFSLDQGCEYSYSFDVHATTERTMQWRLQLNGGDYHAYVSDLITVNEEVQHVTCDFVMEEPSDPAPRLCINMGMAEGCPEDLGEHSVYFDNFALYLTDSSGRVDSATESNAVSINVDQVGYLPDAEKIAVIRAEAGSEVGGAFDVVNTETDEVVFSGELTDAKENTASEEATAIADFSEVTEAGTYKIVTEQYGESFAFTIGDAVYADLTDQAIRLFYLQRCGEAVEDEIFAHDVCHSEGAIRYNSEQSSLVDTTGGWHDAGDYGRYTVAGAKAAADLMLTYETYGDSFGDDTGIPESGNGVPDLLDEVRYELDWMLKMQDPDTGGVYHKVTCENFPGSVMPEEETNQLILAPISTTATADFAAAMAMAARVFEGTDAEFSQTCLTAAELAWTYLEQTPNDGIGFQNPSSISTGAYDDKEDMDERYWALAELYKTTKDAAYLSLLKEYDVNEIEAALGWQTVGTYGMYAYLTSGDTGDYYTAVETKFFDAADAALAKAEEDAYGVALGSEDYCWGSNMSVANNGMLFLMADQLKPDEAYLAAAEKQLHYLLGTNTNSYCFVTGFGTLSPQSVHHRPSEAKGVAMTGMLVGGPDAALEDPYAQATLKDAPPAACYVDNVQSYSCNEITIYWNSPFVYLLTGIENE